MVAIRLETFAGAKLIIGGGEGSRYEVETKAQADHSLPYTLAAALIDREMTNAAYERGRIQGTDVQTFVRSQVSSPHRTGPRESLGVDRKAKPFGMSSESGAF